MNKNIWFSVFTLLLSGCFTSEELQFLSNVSVPNCRFPDRTTGAGQSVEIGWTGDGVLLPEDLRLETDVDVSNKGEVTLEEGILTYHTPSNVPQNLNIKVWPPADGELQPHPCSLRVNSGFGSLDDGVSEGLVGRIFELDPGTSRLPDFDSLTPLPGAILASSLDLPDTDFLDGFPGVTDRFEWFAIEFRGRLKVDVSGTYAFALNSDDGSRLFIDGELVVDNDKKHPVKARFNTIEISAGFHEIRVEYFQGPRKKVALQLAWRNSNILEWDTNGDNRVDSEDSLTGTKDIGSEFIIPASQLFRP